LSKNALFAFQVFDLNSLQCSIIAPVVWYVMNIEWDYNYYQPWSDNEWLVDEMLAMLDEDVTMQ